MASFDFDSVDHLTVATVGEPGDRTFMIQAARLDQQMTVKCEKQQIRVLSSYIAELLEGLSRPGHLPDDMELQEPFDIAWVAGAMSAQYDADLDRFVILIESVADFDAPEFQELDTARIIATREQVAALIIRGTSLVEAGRPPCPLCGYPLDQSGHACPRTNGNRPPNL